MSLIPGSHEIGTWWGRHTQAPNRIDYWMLGALDLVVERTETAWVIRSRHVARIGKQQGAFKKAGLTRDELNGLIKDPSVASALSPYYSSPFSSLTLAAKGPAEDLIFSPALPEHLFSIDLSESPLLLDPGDQTTLAITLPLQIRIDLAAPQGGIRAGCEIFLEPTGETWSGTSPLDGELAQTCWRNKPLLGWSSRMASLDVAGLSLLVTNMQKSALLITRLTIPCHRLSLFHSPQSGFWCDTLILEAREAAPGFGSRTQWSQRTDRALPKEAGSAQFISHPRAGSASNSATLKSLAAFGGSLSNLFRERG